MPSMHTIETAAVVGSGYMGGGIAQILALHGRRVLLGDVDGQTAEQARLRLIEQAHDFESQGLMPAGAGATITENLFAADTIEAAVREADYIAEAIPEIPALKLEILQRISTAASTDAIIGTNTSAIPIAELSRVVTHPQRFLGIHWMNPAPFIPGVEIIPGPDTAPETVQTAEQLMLDIGKTPARVADTPGFVANRLQFALYKEASRIVEEGTATPAQIDAVVSNSFGFRLALFGPFVIADMAGLDVYESSYRSLEKAYGDRFTAPPSLAAAVEEGSLGFKSGKGLTSIDPNRIEDLLAYRDNAYGKLCQLRTELGKAPGL